MFIFDAILDLFNERNPLAGLSLLAAVVCGVFAAFSASPLWSWVLGTAAGIFAILAVTLLIRGE